ncbi:heavy metal-binding domain-containing protein [Acidianus sp. HS-5]|uniref:heavy metal-binding domain-containing protein n=1 Tax=Acidianus sp. HS-5 TaxID=2886040 RepID=UPI001F29047A|nr:heavy metal-binding domain-containing protein [Acidianus sp. HS-5]BDC17920.1 hypothetical protein HS5_08100 [Acidianus sp. HS-5]
MSQQQEIFITTADEIPGYTVIQIIGIVVGVSLLSKKYDLSKEEEAKKFLEESENARANALKEMLQRAKEFNSTAVISVRFDSHRINDEYDEIIAYGTAVKVIKSVH